MGTPENALTLLALSTADRRQASPERALALLERVDFDVLLARLSRRRLLPLVCARLEALAPGALPKPFLEAAAEMSGAVRAKAATLEHFTGVLADRLHGAGVEAVVLKGPFLAERLYGRAEFRTSTDIDLLVLPEQFHEAIRVLEEDGYRRPKTAEWGRGLPLFETSLVASTRWFPPVDLHWRVHWYEREFARALIERSVAGPGSIRFPDPVDEFALMLVMFARDGLSGARALADAAAWWDRYGPEEGAPLLEALLETHEPLRRALVAAAAVVESLVGVPTERVVGRAARAGLPSRLQNWSLEGRESDHQAATTLVDWLLRPRRDSHAFVRRHIFIPSPVAAEAYGLENRSALLRRLTPLRYGLITLKDLIPAWCRVMWRVRGGRQLGARAG